MRKRILMVIPVRKARLEEAVGLARAIDLTIAEALIAPVSQIRPATYLGRQVGSSGSSPGMRSSWW